jgi:hypothetical protein
MRFQPCPRCGGHGTLLSDYNWAEEACPECRGVGLVIRPWIDDVTDDDEVLLYADVETPHTVVNRVRGAFESD